MRTKLVLDTNVLARICHPIKHRDVQAWFHEILDQKPPAFEISLSAITFYELHRGFLKVGASSSIEQLKGLARHLRWLPITLEAAEKAAELWSLLGDRERNRISDADLLIGAQTILEGAVLVSSDRDLAACGALIGLDVREWNEIGSGAKQA